MILKLIYNVIIFVSSKNGYSERNVIDLSPVLFVVEYGRDRSQRYTSSRTTKITSYYNMSFVFIRCRI